MDSKFNDLLHIDNRYGMDTEDYEKLLPLILEALEIKVSDLPYVNKGDFVFEAARKKNKAEALRLASENKEHADDQSQMFSNVLEVVKKLKNSNALDNALENIYRSSLSLGGDDSTPEVTETPKEDKPAEETPAQVEVTPELTPTEKLIASNKILEEHSDEVAFEKDGITAYRPRYRGAYESDADYVKFLEEYYNALFGYLNNLDKNKSKVTEIENQIEDAKKKRDEALEKINNIKKQLNDLLTPENMATMSPEDIEKENKRLNEELMKEMKNYRFYLEKIKDLEKSLETEKNRQQAQTPEKKDVPLLTDGREHKKDVPLLTDGKEKEIPLLPPHVEPPEPSEEITEEISEETTEEITEEISEETTEEITEEISEEVTEEVKETPKKGRRLEVILNDLIKGLGIQRKDDKAYNLSNIQVSGAFKSKLKQGNYIYNTVAGLNIGTYLSIPINFIKKIVGKIKMTPAAKNRIETLKSRIESLPEEDLMVIYKEYRADRSGQNRDYDLVNTLLGERIGRFVNGKVAEINAKITTLYKKIVEDFKKIVALGKEIDATEDENKVAELEAEQAALFTGKAADIAEIERLQREGREWYSGGGHGFEEDMKAARSKMTFMGKRFSKSNNTNEELSNKEAELVSELDEAIQTQDDERALYAFLQREKLLSDNTIIKKSILGKRSVGDRYYQPLVTKVDYRNDPFVSDLMGAVATVGGIINIAGQVRNMAQVKAQQDALNQANVDAQKIQDQIRGYGDRIQDESGIIHKGQQVQAAENELGYMNTAERYTLDATDWGLGTNQYRTLDNATHAAYNQRYADLQDQLGNVANQYQSGAMTLTDALRSMDAISLSQQRGFVDLLTQYQPTLVQYAATHPQFDLTGLVDSVNTIISNPNAISDMYAAQAAISEIGRELQQFTIQGGAQAANITMSIWPQIVGTGSAYVLATNVARQMQANAVNGKYGNEVIDMISSLDNEELEGVHR